jgi:uncharacterized protein (DUF2062 family)
MAASGCNVNMDLTPARIRHTAALWLRQGTSPRRLALTLALGFAIGCLPVIGVPTLLCAALAIVLRLNLPAIQAANYAAMPLQLALVVPFVRLGGWLFAWGPHRAAATGVLFHLAAFDLAMRAAALAGQALLAWLVVAIPAVILITLALAAMLRRLSAPAHR